jgi:hypothetical protein
MTQDTTPVAMYYYDVLYGHLRGDLTMQLRTRIEGGGTRPLNAWGVDSEYGTLRDVLIGPIDHFTWQPGKTLRRDRVDVH